jgi:3-oxoacyl-[acyl-carrier-protein] synthase-1
MAGISSDQVSYINVHGTGTPNNDESEGKALMALFNPVPPFSSTKSYTGHTLAAAGGIEAVISVLSLQNGEIYPNLNYKTRMDDMNCDPVTRVMTQQDLKYILSNSFGFGGNNTSLLFKNV